MNDELLKSSIWYQRDNYTAYYTNGDGFVTYSEAEEACKVLPKVNVFFHESGMLATHNMPCPVCKTNHAMFVASAGYFDVCYKCQGDGWSVTKRPNKNLPWWRKLLCN